MIQKASNLHLDLPGVTGRFPQLYQWERVDSNHQCLPRGTGFTVPHNTTVVAALPKIVLPPRFELDLPPWKGGDLATSLQEHKTKLLRGLALRLIGYRV